MPDALPERPGLVTFKGQPITLVGQPVDVGQAAPDATLVKTDLSNLRIADLSGNVVLLSVVPSVDTRVCDLQTRRFNEEAANLADNVKVLTVSCDLPFALSRWCGAADADAILPVSDYMDREFGKRYGLVVKELGVLARSVLVLDASGVIRYFQLVQEIAEEPDYEKALAAARALV